MTISDGDWSTLFASPLSLTLWAIAIIGFIAPMIVGRYVRLKRRDEAFVGD